MARLARCPGILSPDPMQYFQVHPLEWLKYVSLPMQELLHTLLLTIAFLKLSTYPSTGILVGRVSTLTLASET